MSLTARQQEAVDAASWTGIKLECRAPARAIHEGAYSGFLISADVTPDPARAGKCLTEAKAWQGQTGRQRGGKR